VSAVTVHRVEHTINGRDYRIEVSSVAGDKWRAQIARAPGGSRAMMPFYGKTPDEAVEQLSRWLTLAHARSTPQV
jgi:tartrate dehydratase alpha subunit/fumarate hydratase class I-like protein